MYWNAGVSYALNAAVMLNSNIRCIEIIQLQCANSPGESWIVTLDVLKCFFFRRKCNFVRVE